MTLVECMLKRKAKKRALDEYYEAPNIGLRECMRCGDLRETRAFKMPGGGYAFICETCYVEMVMGDGDGRG